MSRLITAAVLSLALLSTASVGAVPQPDASPYVPGPYAPEPPSQGD